MKLIHNGSATVVTPAGVEFEVIAQVFVDTSQPLYDWKGTLRGDHGSLWEAFTSPEPVDISFGGMTGKCIIPSVGGTPPNGIGEMLGSGEIKGFNPQRV